MPRNYFGCEDSLVREGAKKVDRRPEESQA